MLPILIVPRQVISDETAYELICREARSRVFRNALAARTFIRHDSYLSYMIIGSSHVIGRDLPTGNLELIEMESR